jgi:proteic killer suppression protein
MFMDVTFKDRSLDRLETDTSYSADLGDAVVGAYRKTMQHIRSAADERTFYARRSFRFEKLTKDRDGQYSMRLNDQWHLIVEMRGNAPSKVMHIIEIANYH